MSGAQSEVGKEVELKTKARADEIRDQLAELGRDFGGRYWSLGLLAAEVAKTRIWEILNFESETDFRISVKIGRSTYYRCRRLATEIALPLLEKEVLTRARLNRLTLENAEQLLRLDTRRRFSESWVERALTMTEAEFQEQVDHVIENGEDPETDLGQKEKLARLVIHCTASQKEVIENTFAEFAHAQDPPLEKDDYGKILEFICAEIHNTLQTELERLQDA
jgi:hypothetical protein